MNVVIGQRYCHLLRPVRTAAIGRSASLNTSCHPFPQRLVKPPRRHQRGLQPVLDRRRFQRLSAHDHELREVLRGAAETHRRFGYRRLHVILRRDGDVLNRKRTQRLYREEGLSVRRRRSRKRAIGTRAPLVTEALANARWSVDFVQDQFADGRRFRILNVIDDVTKESLAAVVDTSISGRRVSFSTSLPLIATA